MQRRKDEIQERGGEEGRKIKMIEKEEVEEEEEENV